MKYACEQFDGKTNFGIWQSTVKDILVQQGLLKPLLGNMPKSMDQDDWEELQGKAVSTISIHVKLEEEDQAILLLSSLPKSYETLKTTLLIRKETLLVDNVMSALMDSSRVNGTRSSSGGEGLVVRSENNNCHGRGSGRYRSKNLGHGKDRSKSREKQDKSCIECWYCKEIIHIAKKCPERKEKKNGKKHVNNANVVEEDDKKTARIESITSLGIGVIALRTPSPIQSSEINAHKMFDKMTMIRTVLASFQITFQIKSEPKPKGIFAGTYWQWMLVLPFYTDEDEEKDATSMALPSGHAASTREF
ncbi:hypothetical protein RJ640_029674, partial [Escallonia rubra]